jgi:hypothetical protein
MAAVSSSFDEAQTCLNVVGEIAITDRQINKLATEMGTQLADDRDEKTERFVKQPLPREKTAPETPIELAAVFTDGGRMQTREPGQGRGVHNPHWRETKNASFHRMTCKPQEVDPQPELPDCFCNEAYVEKLVNGLKKQKNTTSGEPVAADEMSRETRPSLDDSPCWQPETVFRTCLSSLVGSDEFGPMMAAEADARGFFQATKGVVVGDGQAYNWTIQQRWFPEFVPVTDFVHVVEYVYEAAKAVHVDKVARWHHYVAWATACWQGRVEHVIGELQQLHTQLDPLPVGQEPAQSDPHVVLPKTITYLSNNRMRMKYPDYRREGLPVTSSLAESLVKQVSKRVKGTEMFWDDGPSGEAILQLRAACLSDGDCIAAWLATRHISPFSSCCRSGTLATSV